MARLLAASTRAVVGARAEAHWARCKRIVRLFWLVRRTGVAAESKVVTRSGTTARVEYCTRTAGGATSHATLRILQYDGGGG